MCDEWMDYTVFRRWALTNGYEDYLTIDRIDNNDNYEPNNCRWVTNTVNVRNQSRTKLSIDKAIAIRHKYLTGMFKQVQLAKEYNVPQETISLIINNKAWV